MMGTCVNSLWQRTRSTLFAASMGEPRPDRTAESSTPCAGSSSRQGVTRTWSAVSLSSTAGCERTTKRHPRCGAPSWTWSHGRGCFAAGLDRRECAMPAWRTLQRKCVETRGGYSCWGSGENEALWYGRAIVGLRDLWKSGR